MSRAVLVGAVMRLETNNLQRSEPITFPAGCRKRALCVTRLGPYPEESDGGN
jgi:hypothetical protein